MRERQTTSATDLNLEFNLLEGLQVLVKRKSLIIKVCGGAIITSIVFSLLLPNIYSATAKVLPPQKDTSAGLSALLGQAGGLAGLAAGGLGGSGGELYLGILKSRSVGDAVIKRLDLVNVYQTKTLEAARKRLGGTVKVLAGKDGIISIIAEDKDPNRAALLANTIVDELGKTTVRLNLSKAGTERAFLEKRLDLVKKDLRTAEEDLKTFAARNKIVHVESQASASIAAIARIKAELASREVQLAVLKNQQTEQSPEVQAIQTGLTRLRQELGTLAGNGDSGDGIPAIGNVPRVGIEYTRKLRELKTQEAIFEQLTKQYEVAKLSEAKDTSSLQILDEAVVPVHKSKPLRAVIVVLSTVAALFVSIVIVFVQDFLSKMSNEDRQTLEDIKKHALSFK
jgi:tyrosine-protein kinase Etk/Wzc